VLGKIFRNILVARVVDWLTSNKVVCAFLEMLFRERERERERESATGRIFVIEFVVDRQTGSNFLVFSRFHKNS